MWWPRLAHKADLSSKAPSSSILQKTWNCVVIQVVDEVADPCLVCRSQFISSQRRQRWACNPRCTAFTFTREAQGQLRLQNRQLLRWVNRLATCNCSYFGHIQHLIILCFSPCWAAVFHQPSIPSLLPLLPAGVLPFCLELRPLQTSFPQPSLCTWTWTEKKRTDNYYSRGKWQGHTLQGHLGIFSVRKTTSEVTDSEAVPWVMGWTRLPSDDEFNGFSTALAVLHQDRHRVLPTRQGAGQGLMRSHTIAPLCTTGSPRAFNCPLEDSMTKYTVDKRVIEQ